jgi:hypothetical protein
LRPLLLLLLPVLLLQSVQPGGVGLPLRCGVTQHPSLIQQLHKVWQQLVKLAAAAALLGLLLLLLLLLLLPAWTSSGSSSGDGSGSSNGVLLLVVLL